MAMQFSEAQRDMRTAYVNGGVGVLVSGIIWIISGLVAQNISLNYGTAALFFGGMAIPPMSLAVEKLFFKREKPVASNPLEMLALQSTPFLIVGLVIAYVVSESHANWFFAIALMAVGARYLVFQTIYGIGHYIVLGAFLAAFGFVAIWFVQIPPHVVAMAGGAIELLFSGVILRRQERAS
jgi:hypothetical protein